MSLILWLIFRTITLLVSFLQFYISLGLAVGGIHAFPDGCRSGSHEKPWKNTGAKVSCCLPSIIKMSQKR